MDPNKHFNPLWGGQFSMIGTGWKLYTNTISGTRSIADLVKPFDLAGKPAPLRQRVLTTGVSTAGVQLSELVDDEHDLPSLDTTGPEDAFDRFDKAQEAGGKPLPKTTWEFNLFPFRFVARAVLLPVVGLIDIVAQKAIPVVYTVVSLVYQSLPLTSIVRLSRFVRIIKKSPTYDYAPAPQDPSMLNFSCLCCGQIFPRRTRRAIKPSKVGYTTTLRCEHVLARSLHGRGEFVTPFQDDVPNNPFDYNDLASDSFKGVANLPQFKVTKDLLPRIAELLGAGALSSCHHGIRDHTRVSPTAFVPEPTVDGLYALPPEKVWRKENNGNGLRCVFCYRDDLHCWHPAVTRAIRNFDPKLRLQSCSDKHLQGFWDVLSVILALVKRMRRNFDATATYRLLSVSSSRLDAFLLPRGDGPFVIIVQSDGDADLILRRHPIMNLPHNFVVVLPLMGNETSLAGWRLILAALCPLPCGFLICNQANLYYEPLALSILESLKKPWSSCSPNHAYPFYMGAAYIKGCTSVLTAADYAYLFYTCGFVYGWDEVVPAIWERCTVVLVSDPGLPEIMAPLVTDKLPPYSPVDFLLVDSSANIIGSYLADFSRSNIFIMKALCKGFVDQGRVTIAHAFADSRPISTVSVAPDFQECLWSDIRSDNPRFAPSSAPGENIISEISHTHGGVIWFTFGSRGDRSPVLANARYFASLGGKATVIHLNDEDEGKLLANTSGTVEAAKTTLFLRAREYLASFANMAILVPYQLFHIGGVSFTLAPPDDIIHPFVSSNNVLIAFCYALLGSVYTPDLRIGAFASSHCLPTSADGKNFVKSALNRAKRGSKAAYWGGDNAVPSGWEHIPLLPPGDHYEMLPDIETFYTSGTVGAVTAGALCGCEVIAIGKGLDREYRRPYDAGQGFIDGQSPDRIFLALGSLYPSYYGVWLRNNWYNVPEIWAWFGPESFGLLVFRCIMFYLYLTRLQKASFLSTTPLTTLILMLDGRGKVPIATYLWYLIVAKTADTLLKVLSKNYLWLTEKFVSLNSRMMASALAFWVAQSYGWFWGLVAAQGTKILEPMLFWTVTWLPITFGANPDPPLFASDEYGVVEFVLVYRIIPVFHVAILFPFAGLRLEGKINAYGLYQASLAPGKHHSLLRFPTRIRLSYVRSKLKTARALPYGPTWHCYSCLWDLLSQETTRLGVSAVPFMITNLISSLLSTAAFGVLSLGYTIATTLPAIGGVSTRSSGVMSMFANAIRATVDMLEDARGDYSHLLNTWFARFTYLAPLPEWLYH